MRKNIDILKAVYGEKLKDAHARYPKDYSWPISELPAVLTRMNIAIDRMSFNKDGHAWKHTCKVLGIKHTYQAIADFIKEEK